MKLVKEAGTFDVRTSPFALRPVWVADPACSTFGLRRSHFAQAFLPKLMSGEVRIPQGEPK